MKWNHSPEELDFEVGDGPPLPRQWITEKIPVQTIENGQLINADHITPRQPAHIPDAPNKLFQKVNKVLPEEARYNHPAHLYNALRKHADFDDWPIPFTLDEFTAYAQFLIERKLGVESADPILFD